MKPLTDPCLIALDPRYVHMAILEDLASKKSTDRREAHLLGTFELPKGFMTELTIPEFKARLAALEEALPQAEIRATAGGLPLEMIHETRNPLDALNSLTFLARKEADKADKVRLPGGRGGSSPSHPSEQD
jgi:hypothetical protein